MPVARIEELPDEARVWVFGADRPLSGSEAASLLEAVDEFLAGWQAHGAALTAGRDWRESRFLTVAVDSSGSAASGCSIDALYGTLRRVERGLGVRLLGSSRVYWRDASGVVQSAKRGDLDALVRDGVIAAETSVFDLTVQSLAAWRCSLEVPARASWHAAYMMAGR